MPGGLVEVSPLVGLRAALPSRRFGEEASPCARSLPRSLCLKLVCAACHIPNRFGEANIDLALSVARWHERFLTPFQAMLAVSLSETALRPLLGDGIELAAVNAPDRCVVGGPIRAVQRFAAALEARGVEARLLYARGDWLQIELASGEVGWVWAAYTVRSG